MSEVVEKAATVAPPPPKPSTRNLGEPPTANAPTRNLGKPPGQHETRGNLKPVFVQLNVQLEKSKHKEFRLAALDEDMTLIEYVVYVHDQYQQRKVRKRA